MAYQSSANVQPKLYRVNLVIDDATLDEALVAEVETLANQNGHPADHSKLKTMGLFDKYVYDVIVNTLNSHLVLGS